MILLNSVKQEAFAESPIVCIDTPELERYRMPPGFAHSESAGDDAATGGPGR